ncbi:hypothetical protein RJ640_015753, partial [Escallonia rubra]
MDDKSIALDAVIKESVDLLQASFNFAKMIPTKKRRREVDILINAGIGICYTQENPPLEEVFAHLKCSKQGLSSDEVQERLELFGYNKLEEKYFEIFGLYLESFVRGDGSICSNGYWLAHGGPGDYHDFVDILVLLVINSTISFIEENNAGNAAAALMARLAPKAKVLRDLKWNEEDAAMLVPGDIVSIKLGNIVPTDA